MKQKFITLNLITILFLLSGWQMVQLVYASGTTFTVTGYGDFSDANIGDGICDTNDALAGDQCSLRAAIEELNELGSDTTPHRIEFNISGTGPFTITPDSPLPDIEVPIEIDGTTQPGTTCPTSDAAANLQIVLDGSNLTNEDGFHLRNGSDGSTIRGLAINNFRGSSIQGSAIYIGSDNNIVRCNHLGIGVDGVSDQGNSVGIHIVGSDNIIGGQNSHAQRNVISGNNSTGIYIHGTSGENNRIGGNFVGTTADGMGRLGNNSLGVYVAGNNNIIGGTSFLARNVISSSSIGLRINGGDNNTVSGNFIGSAQDGQTPLSNYSHGIEILGEAIGNTIGGVAPNQSNQIVHNGGVGIKVAMSLANYPQQNTIRGNVIFANGSLGIDLGHDGVDINDPGDADGNENEHQNYPVLTSNINSLNINGLLDSHPNTQYIIDLYRSESCNASGYGGGQEHLVSESVTTDGAGQAIFDVTASGAAAGDTITATATDPNGNTSEFSACITVETSPPEYYLYLPVILK